MQKVVVVHLASSCRKKQAWGMPWKGGQGEGLLLLLLWLVRLVRLLVRLVRLATTLLPLQQTTLEEQGK